MSEVNSLDSYYNFTPTRSERARVYIGDGMTEDERETAAILASDWYSEKPISKTLILLPVAAHQDAGHIFHTMGEYNKQRNCDPFTILMFLNYPDDVANASARGARLQVEKAKVAFPQLDIRSATLAHSGDMTIGSIRRDMWNAAFILADANELFAGSQGDVIGMNHDIDTTMISPHYVSRVQKHYQAKQLNAISVGATQAVLNPIGTRVSHAVIPSHPNVGKVTRWADNTYFQTFNHASYEAGIIVPFSFYAQAGGFKASSKTHETGTLTRDTPLKCLSGAQLYTSPRRYIDRLADHGRDGVWTEQSFSDNDRCRSNLRRDISTVKADELIMETLDEDLRYYWLESNNYGLEEQIEYDALIGSITPEYRDKLRATIHKNAKIQLAKAERLMRKFVGSEVLADIIASSFDLQQYAERRSQLLVDFNRALMVDNSGANL